MRWTLFASFMRLVSLLLLASMASAQTKYKVQKPPLDTDWTYKVGTNPWPEYPRPQLRRDAWKSLNGIWTWKAANGKKDVENLPKAGALEREVLVPSCIESALSGLQILDVRDMWYERTFEVPEEWKDRKVLLNFESVDYKATVFVNGAKKTTHVGGYDRFTIDVTENIKFGASNELLVFVHDPTDSDVIPIGKQTLKPSHIFYRSCSGIWQQVWIEAVPGDHITHLDVAAGADGKVSVTVHTSQQAKGFFQFALTEADGSTKASHSGVTNQEFTFTVESPKLWWPDSPALYNFTVTLESGDKVHSYTGFRTISKGKVDGVTRPLLNGEFVFQFGTLDQGFWPDGLYTPPNREAMIYDLQLLKKFGFNSIRKHIKVEPDLFYQACDQLGLMVIQDMPSLPASGDRKPDSKQQAEFKRQLEVVINQHKSYPSIVTWVIYNEGWGQQTVSPPPEKDLTQLVRQLDKTRLINSVSGWDDHGFGDYHDNHNYAEPQCGTPFYSQPKTPYDPERIGIAGEYGGIGHNVSLEHLWNVKEAIATIKDTYEINENLESYNYRASVLFRDIREQTQRFACSGAIYTQTTDVEGEVNGLVTYDRRFLRPQLEKWQDDIQSVYKAAASRGGRKVEKGKRNPGSLLDL
ncbi:glycoside hydrolase superfamily [Fusarium solani]|uniref:Glycoside hydrolase superfamily n=1 Tax=Fusarium solani TaxID=169388 RepID=A0A9P9KI08_FUSSL|nr:glycoside hydrolase superfamily [Fusarium solani]KAH7253304.1 glycoside hydrolase superfamily [Fusarium solani]